MASTNKNANIVAIVTMFFIFAMISFVTNMAAPFGNIWGFKYEWAGMMGNLMNFVAYLFMGIPAGKMLVRFGYKKTALIALAVGVIGLLIQLLSSKVGADATAFIYGGQNVCWNLIIYLFGALVCGFCVCMLNTVVNPMLNLLGGGGNKGNQLVQAGGSLNSLSGTLTPLFVGMLIGTVTDKTSMTDVMPLLIAGIAIFAVALVIIAFINIIEPQGDLSNKTFEHSPLCFRHCLLGIIAIFFYVGIEIGIPGELNFYISKSGFEGSAAIAGSFAAAYWALMLCGRFLSTIISGKVSTRAQMITVSSLSIVLLLIAIIMPETITVAFENGEVPMKCAFIAACGICTSIMWGGIFNLATEGLGKYTPAASGLFMTMVVGGGILPVLQDYIGRTTDYISSYWLVVAMLAYILFYSFIGCKNVNKDIPVE